MEITTRPVRAGGLASAFTIATVTVLSQIPSASAAPPERGVIADEFHDTVDDFCGVEGLTVTSDVTIAGAYSVKVHQPSDPAYYAEHFTVDQVVTNPETGLSTEVFGRSLSKDVVIRQEGNILTITSLTTGNSSLYGPDGQLLAKRSGQLRFVAVIDNGGTPDNPDDDVELSFELIKATGPNDNYCDFAPLLLG